MSTNYRSGADFERRVKADFERHGFVAVRSAGSKTPADVYCFAAGEIVFVQCKRDGRLNPDEWNEFWAYCQRAGALPLLAKVGSNGRGIEYRRLTGRKEGRGRQPYEPWEI